MTKITELEPEIKKLRAIRWQNMGSHEKGEKEPLSVRVGASTTGDVDLLVLEAEMAQDNSYSVKNPHIPINTEKLAEAKERIEKEGLTPAWEQ